MKYIDAEKLIAEIERKRDSALERQKNLEKIGQETVLNEMIAAELNRLISFVTSLQQEQPVIKKSNALFDKCVENCDPAIMKEVSDNIDKILGRQPEEGLEEAAEEHSGLNFDRQMEYKSFWNDVDTFKAGAEWQKDKILKLIETRISEIIGDAQPNPVLRIELQGIIDKIK